MAEQFSIPTVGDIIAGKYTVEEELGRGAYGVVFRAEQAELGRSVAVKTLLPQAFLQQDIVQRFHREARLIGSLDHANIIRLWDYGVDEGLLYMAVEYVEGRTLMDLVDNDAPLEPERVRHLALQMLDALDHAHDKGIVHRDLKPENIILVQTRTTDGREYEVVKILDFGISKLLRGDGEHQNALKSLTQDGTVLGTPHYMSPENIVGDPIDHRADLYAFGVILYEMLTGVHPFDAPSPSAVMVRHLRDDPPDMPVEFSDTTLGEAIRRCLEKQPWDRIGSARELIELLETDDATAIPRVANRPDSGYRQPRSPEPSPSASMEATIIQDRGPSDEAGKDNRAVFAIIGLLLLILSVSVGWKVWLAATGPDEPPSVAVIPDDPNAAEQGGTDDPVLDEPGGEALEFAVAPDAGTAALAVNDPVDAGMPSALGGDEPVEEEPREEPDEVASAKEERPRPKPRPRPEPEPKDEPPSEVEVQITSVPTNVSVTIDGVPVGSTPLKRTVVTKKTIEVRFSHIGYKEKVLQVTPAEDATAIRANLERDHLKLN